MPRSRGGGREQGWAAWRGAGAKMEEEEMGEGAFMWVEYSFLLSPALKPPTITLTLRNTLSPWRLGVQGPIRSP